jgi:hypothetical protein
MLADKANVCNGWKADTNGAGRSLTSLVMRAGLLASYAGLYLEQPERPNAERAGNANPL